MKIHTLQTSFITGQLDEAAQARSETPLYRNGAASLRNCEPFVSGGVRARRGSRHLGTLPGKAVLAAFEFSLDQSYIAAFTAGRVDFFYTSDGAPAGGVGGAPWTEAQLRELRFAQLGDVMWVVHPTFWPREIVRTGADTWVLRNMEFDGVRGTPTYRYAPAHITCQPAGVVASTIQLQAQPSHQGIPTSPTVGMEGQARLVSEEGVGEWHPFVVTSVNSLTIGVAWLGEGLPSSADMEVQFAMQDYFGEPGGLPPPSGEWGQ